MATSARRTVLWLSFAVSAITYLDRVCISAAAPFIMEDLGLSVLQMSVVFSAFTLAYSIFEVPSGWLGDLIGARRVLTRIVLWWSAFTMLSGAAWSFISLLTIRFLFGAGEAGAFPNISHAFSRWFPASERGTASGIMFLGSRLGGAVAPMFAILFIKLFGWRVSFVLFGLIGVAWAWIWYWWYRDDPAEHPGVDATELAWIRQGSGHGRAITSHDRVAVPWSALMSSPNLYAICAMYFGFGYGLYFYFTWLPTYLIKVLGFSALAGGLFAGLPFLLAGAADVVGGRVTDHLAATRGLWVARCGVGSISFAVCALLVLASVLVSSGVAKAVLLALALGAADFALSACWAVCLDVGTPHAGVVTGCMNTVGQVGGFLGPLVVGFVVETYGSWTLPFYITAAIYMTSAILWLLVNPHKRIVATAAISEMSAAS